MSKPETSHAALFTWFDDSEHLMKSRARDVAFTHTAGHRQTVVCTCKSSRRVHIDNTRTHIHTYIHTRGAPLTHTAGHRQTVICTCKSSRRVHIDNTCTHIHTHTGCASHTYRRPPPDSHMYL